jgi:DNA polymerase-3 subunit gamma/tau
MEDVLDMSKEHIQSLKEEASMVKPEVLMRYIRIFSELSNQVKYATQKRIVIEIAIIKLCKPEMEKDYESVLDRLASLEAKVAHGVPVATVVSQTGATAAIVAPKTEKPQLPKAIPEDIKQVIKSWKSLLSEIGGITKTYLNKAVPSLGGNQELLLVLDDANAYEYLNENRSDCITSLKEVIANRIGKEIEVTVRRNDSGHSAKETVPDLRDFIQFEIEEENF